MKSKLKQITTAFKAVARVAYTTNEVIPIYPCTPTSEMSALTEEWSATAKNNIYGKVPTVFEMQSEGGVAGTMHGAIQTGSLSTTFTASQGLLLMIPNMYKIAGQLLPNVMHVATRSIATHALSVYCDHSDIMAVRQTGYAILGGSSVQEAQDLALIAQAATLSSRIPFVHFFDGFRTSHEYNSIIPITQDQVTSLIDQDTITAHKSRALSPEHPTVRGTAQGPDIFFQGREAQNGFYDACPDIVQNTMDQFAALTGRAYQLFEYIGSKHAEHVIIAMGSSTDTIEKTIKSLNRKNESYGLIKVKLFRPFSKKHLLQALPNTVKTIAVLDRTKEPGSTGEPLYLDIVNALNQAYQNKEIESIPKIIGGRFGLSSKEFTPTMVQAVINNSENQSSKFDFTVGITDDVTHLSLELNEPINLTYKFQAIFYRQNTSSVNSKYEQFLDTIDPSDYVQSFTECDYNKFNPRNVTHLRVDTKSIKAPYLIEDADLIYCESINSLLNDNALERLNLGGILILNTEKNKKQVRNSLSLWTKARIRSKSIRFYLVNNCKTEHSAYNPEDLLCLDLLKNSMLLEDKTETCYGLEPLDILSNSLSKTTDEVVAQPKGLIDKMLQNKGNDVKVSEISVDGSYQTNNYSAENLEIIKHICSSEDNIQLQEPLFKNSIGVDGCGEAPYYKALSQIFGDRLLIANATGSSSIFGGALPTTPWHQNKEGKGPAWANSLFEDNAEFGLGFQLSLDYQEDHSKCVWIVGGDGWAHDIGFGGLDHVLASGKNVNILVLDNEVYDNTGGQMSKSTPYGAQAKFAFNGKRSQKKDLGWHAMNYGNAYVASVAIGADPEHTYKALKEAQSFEGPSIVIAYCHSPSHGIDMKTPFVYQQAAVKSGHWLLYRYDPNKENKLQLDASDPIISICDYMKNESRFSKIFELEDDQRTEIIHHIEQLNYDRIQKYKKRAHENNYKPEHNRVLNSNTLYR